ncbi:MAG: hypothetical protein M0Z88_03080, partial [Actinomycetota bacterium]|nr:hypothetical protein [Actinomycetota bacterium]
VGELGRFCGGNAARIARPGTALPGALWVSPTEAASGQVVRNCHNRYGNRQANHSLWRIITVRLTCDPTTKAYAARRRAEAKSDRAITRCLKCNVTREVFGHLVRPGYRPTLPSRSGRNRSRGSARASWQHSRRRRKRSVCLVGRPFHDRVPRR